MGPLEERELLLTTSHLSSPVLLLHPFYRSTSVVHGYTFFWFVPKLLEKQYIGGRVPECPQLPVHVVFVP